MNVDDQIKISSDAICKLIRQSSEDERGFLSQNIIDKLRTFVEAVSVKVSGENTYNYKIFQNKGKLYVASRGDLKFLSNFHRSLQKTVSHYLPTEENSERLMLKYHEYLLRVKALLLKDYDLEVLQNIEKFPVSVDPVLTEYYEKISNKIEECGDRAESDYKDRYYIKKD